MTLKLVPELDRMDHVVQALRRYAGPTRAEPGCISCTVYRDITNPNVILYQEYWASWNQIASHVQSSRYAQLIQLMETSADTPVLQFHYLQKTYGIEYLENLRIGPTNEKK